MLEECLRWVSLSVGGLQCADCSLRGIVLVVLVAVFLDGNAKLR